MIPTAIGLVIYGVVTGEHDYLKIALAVGVGAVLLAIFQWIFASGGKCPLCMMPVLVKKGCSRNRNAKCVAGSYRLPVAYGVLVKGHFRCPYCNEPTMLELRETVRRS
ncbi:hypothetical protein OKA04_23060 [Luteolibacter flavescens]|uniref:Uncharacterized protein n=1 Tax=Luteolibacter flavescens TaxID=1859460 RepID=A0ABT3FVL7_9BACT|nr:hypothetical protein [Luteolibacter flavescens]MCW1887636.1 hypothetical protein [Luteolibacter flavescens]